MPEVTVRRAQSAEDLQALHALRWQVFVEEQGVPPELESDELDETACQALAYMDGSAAGTGRVVMLEGGEARVGRMAVRADVRRQGVGGRVLRFLEAEAAKEGAVRSRCTRSGTCRRSTSRTGTLRRASPSRRRASSTS